jgi:hypothetical protein
MQTFSYYAGTTPVATDTAWSLWAKIVIRLSQITGNSNFLPAVCDCQRQLMVKALKLVNLL